MWINSENATQRDMSAQTEAMTNVVIDKWVRGLGLGLGVGLGCAVEEEGSLWQAIVNQARVSRRLPQNRGTAGRTAWNFADHLSTAHCPAGEPFKMPSCALGRLVYGSGVLCLQLEEARRSSAWWRLRKEWKLQQLQHNHFQEQIFDDTVGIWKIKVTRVQRKMEVSTIEGRRACQT